MARNLVDYEAGKTILETAWNNQKQQHKTTVNIMTAQQTKKYNDLLNQYEKRADLTPGSATTAVHIGLRHNRRRNICRTTATSTARATKSLASQATPTAACPEWQDQRGAPPKADYYYAVGELDRRRQGSSRRGR